MARCGAEDVYAEKGEIEKLYWILNNIINQYLNRHPIPDQSKMAHISSIYKKGSKKQIITEEFWY